MKTLCTYIVFLFALNTEAKLFQNSYLSFDLPKERWNCVLEKTEWICRSTSRKESREAIIIFTAKETGPQDNYRAYENHLKTPKSVSSRQGKPIQTILKQIKRRKINNHEWVDGLTLHGEIPAFYTRYLATVKSKIAVLVTFTAHQKSYSKYSRDFIRSIQTLRVKSVDHLFKSLTTLRGSSSNMFGPAGVGAGIPDDMLEEECYEDDEDCYYEDEASLGDDPESLVAILLILLAIGGYFIYKRKKNVNQAPFS